MNARPERMCRQRRRRGGLVGPPVALLFFLLLHSSRAAAVTAAAATAAAGAIVVYPHAPGTVVDPRVVARVGGRGVSHTLAVEDAPPTPQTRDPGHGRPPFTSSRLRLATGRGVSSVRVALQCMGEACSFGQGAVLRGVHFDGHVDHAKRELVFSLPAPARGQQAVHYYLKVVVHNASGAPHFARGKLFYFWLDSQQYPPLLRPNKVAADVTTLGVVANSSSLQTSAIQRLLDKCNASTSVLSRTCTLRHGQLVCSKALGDRTPGKEQHCSIHHLVKRSSASVLLGMCLSVASLPLSSPFQATMYILVAEAAL